MPCTFCELVDLLLGAHVQPLPARVELLTPTLSSTNTGWWWLYFWWLGWWSRWWWTNRFWRSLRSWNIRDKNLGFGAVSKDLRLDCTWYPCRRSCYGNWSLFFGCWIPATRSWTLSTCWIWRQKPTNATSIVVGAFGDACKTVLDA